VEYAASAKITVRDFKAPNLPRELRSKQRAQGNACRSSSVRDKIGTSENKPIMASLTTTSIYLAIRKEDDRSHIEDELVLDGADVSTFGSAKDLWEHFQARPARLVITDRKFGDDFDGMELVRKIRKHYQLPYIYVLMRSAMSQLDEIRTGLEAGVDDYLVKPHNPFQIRSRVLVAMRWLTYIDSITWKQTGAAGAVRG
jgi:PleD family two-component response regulator